MPRLKYANPVLGDDAVLGDNAVRVYASVHDDFVFLFPIQKRLLSRDRAEVLLHNPIKIHLVKTLIFLARGLVRIDLTQTQAVSTGSIHTLSLKSGGVAIVDWPG